MHIGRRHMRVGDDRVLGIDRAVVQVKESLGLALTHHIATFGTGAADLDLLGGAACVIVSLSCWRFKGRLPWPGDCQSPVPLHRLWRHLPATRTTSAR